MDTDLRAGFASYTFSNRLSDFTKLICEEIGKICGASAELRKLDRMILKIQSMIDTIELGYATFPTDILKKSCDAWIQEANNIIYNVDDFLENLSLQLGLPKGDRRVAEELIPNFKISAAHEISGFVIELQELMKEMDTVFVTELVKPKPTVRKQSCYRFHSKVDQTLRIGRHEQRSEVIQILSREDVPVICITGMGGIGKTDFAQSLLNTAQVVDQYSLRIWMSVTVEFDVGRILSSVIECVAEENCKLMDMGLLQFKLKGLLENKATLVVLDNFYTEDYEDWKNLYAPFKAGGSCKIIITSRNSEVSSLVGGEIFHLPVLSDDDCWEIIKQRPFVKNQVHNLEELGTEIAKKCKGLPLVAKMVGNLLHWLPDEEWDSILECKLWDLPQYKNCIVPVLLRSYCSLPPQLKKCFAYCALFPPGYEFEMNHLVLLWMAEGLIRPISGRRLEDIGRDYFRELLCRSFFNFPNEDPLFPNKQYTMHEFTHHMAVLVSSSVFKLIEDKHSYFLIDTVRHLTLCHGDALSMDLQSFPNCDKLRTFLWLCGSNVRIGQHVSVLLEKFRVLRVLNLKSGGITEVPGSIDQLKHLRYLNLSDNGISALPQSVCKLSCLQTVVLKNCPLLDCLPEEFSRLTNLRHLDFDVRDQLRRMPINFRFLVNLQTLHAFIVEAGEGYTIKELKDLTMLGGSICISGLEFVTGNEEASSAFLNRKQWLKRVELQWGSSEDGDAQVEVLTGLKPHERLVELVINNYRGNSFPAWLSDSQSCLLKTICLQGCHCCKALPPLGKLQFLEELFIECMPLLKKLLPSFAGDGDFQSLKSLSFVNMPELSSWSCLGYLCMPHLCDLKFSNCPNLMILPSLGKLYSLQKLEISGCTTLGLLPCFPGTLSIKTLIIRNSPVLRARYKENEGDWCKVKTVPTVEIDGEKLPTTSQQA